MNFNKVIFFYFSRKKFAHYVNGQLISFETLKTANRKILVKFSCTMNFRAWILWVCESKMRWFLKSAIKFVLLMQNSKFCNLTQPYIFFCGDVKKSFCQNLYEFFNFDRFFFGWMMSIHAIRISNKHLQVQVQSKLDENESNYRANWK